MACTFLSVGCDTRLARAELARHLETSATHHMRLLADKLTKLQQVQQAERVMSRVWSTEEEEECSSLPASSDTTLTRTEHQAVRMSGSNLHSQARLIRYSLSLCCQGSYKLFIRELYQKVINLEQNQCQNEIKISQLASQIETLKADKEEILHRNSTGEFVWKIKDFSSYHQKLRNSHSFVIYSKGFYTSYYGYKVCLRSNVYFSEGKMRQCNSQYSLSLSNSNTA